MYTETSTIVRQGPEVGRDRYNVPVYGPDVRTPAPCWYVPQASVEDVDGKEQYTDKYLVQWPPEWLDQVEASSSVELPPLGTFRVLGRPIYQPSGFVVDGYIQAYVERTTG